MSDASIVFLVDPDVNRAERLLFALRSAGILCAAHRSAGLFLADLRNIQTQPRCLIVAIHLPDMSGLDLQRLLRRRRIKMPVVFIADGTGIDEFRQAARQGAIGFFEGNFDDGALLARVQEALEGECASV